MYTFCRAEKLRIGDFTVINHPDTNEWLWTCIHDINQIKILDPLDKKRQNYWPLISTSHGTIFFDPFKNVQVVRADENLSLSDVVDFPIVG